MWFVFALLTFIAWGCADLFYKKGADNEDKYSHLKTSVIVGLVMGVTAFATLLAKQIPYDFRNLYLYLPVSALYILSMTVGYFGLRYLELSVSSPIQNASGAVSCLLLMLFLHEMPDAVSLVAVVLITAGVVALGVFEKKEIVASEDKKYSIGLVAFFMPILYCVIDSLGTFFDGYYLDDLTTTPLVGVTEDTLEDVANISYQLTFFIVAILLLLYLLIFKKETFAPARQKDRLAAALLETGGQLTYVYALSGNAVIAAPVIASYCVLSALLGRLFLKEKLEKKQYLAVALVMLGILLLGIAEALTQA